VDKKQQELLEQYKGYQKVEERVKEPSYRNYLQNVIANRKVIDKLKEWNLSQEPQEEKTREKGDTEEVKKSDARKEEKKGKTPRDDKKEEE
jgi:hypothetical protein